MRKPKLPILTKEELNFTNGALAFFRIDNKPADEVLTYSQKVMFFYLVSKKSKRLQIITSTQYGKSLVVSLACLYISCIKAEMIAVVAPNHEKAKIIMRYYIEHLGDDELFYRCLEANSRLDRLRQEENKARITLNNGGGIYVVSAQERNSLKSIESAMGLGAKNVIGDEYCLINDNTEATIFRMIAGKGEDAFYCKIGNPFYSDEPYSHFKKSWENDKYTHIFIDVNQGIKEGRYNQEFVDEAKTKPLYSILFDCEFPPENEIDDRGYRNLLVFDDLKFSNEATFNGEAILGCDIGGGGDYNVYVIRYMHYAFIAGQNQSNDTMTNVSEIINLMEKYHIKDYNVNIDDIGIGRGVVDRLKEMDYNVNGVSVGGRCDDETFANLKAKINWDASQWVKNPKNYLRPNDNWIQLTWIKYKTRSDKTLIIEPKEELKKRTRKSPDFSEAFSLTFANVGEEEIMLGIDSDSIYG